MQTSIAVSVRNVYGNETVYPACKHSAFLCSIAGTKTITQDMMRKIVAQGYVVTVEAPALSFNQSIVRDIKAGNGASFRAAGYRGFRA